MASVFNLEAAHNPLREIQVEEHIKADIAPLEARKRNPLLQVILQGTMVAQLEGTMISQLGLSPTMIIIHPPLRL